jgi:hypothetical protein
MLKAAHNDNIDSPLDLWLARVGGDAARIKSKQQKLIQQEIKWHKKFTRSGHSDETKSMRKSFLLSAKVCNERRSPRR